MSCLGEQSCVKVRNKKLVFCYTELGFTSEGEIDLKNDLIAYELTSSDCCESFRKAADFIQLLSNFRSLFT